MRKNMRTYLCGISVVVMLVGFSACTRQLASYTIDECNNDSLCMTMLEWDVYGPLTVQEDSLYGEELSVGTCEASAAPINKDKHIARYQPKYNMVDLNEIFESHRVDTAFYKSITYLKCNIHTEEAYDAFVEIKCGMKFDVFLQGDTLERCDVQGLNFYPLKLQRGDNRLVVKVTGVNDDASFEARLCDRNNKQRLYAEGQSGNIIYPLIYDNKVVMTTNGHAHLDSYPAVMTIHDVKGRLLREVTMLRDSFTYHFPELEVGKSYMCSMTMGTTTVRQPVMCGDADRVYERFDSLRKSLPDNHHRAMEIDEVMYRYHFLLHHPTRYEGDWWWQFKISPLTYQLEYIFAHLDSKPGECIGEPNVQFMAYRSPLDGGVGRYLLVTPNHYTSDKPLPLVVAVRPHVTNHHHFFASPQMARQWATNLVQALANRYNYIVMMPEARMYHDEDLIPFAEAEMMCAIDHVKQHYPVDSMRIFLHGNCSGGYRALAMATRHPNYFAATALYAPSYKIPRRGSWSESHAPHRNIKALADMPIMLHGDPMDTHSPISSYKELVDDARKNDLPLQLSLKRNSGQFYNVVLVGEEAFDFFKDKRRDPAQREKKGTVKHPRVIADLYSRPFVYVYNADDTRPAYRAAIDSLRREYETYLFAKLPLVPDTLLTADALAEKNLFLLGMHFRNPHLRQIVNEITLDNEEDYIGTTLTIYPHPRNENAHVVIYSMQDFGLLEHNMHYPWRNGMTRKMVTHDIMN